MTCFCDYEPADFYRARRCIARRQHKCEECASPIVPGDKYEVAFMIYDGGTTTCKTCSACLMLRDAGKISFECFCWAHGNMLEELRELIGGEAWKVDGLRFEFGRRFVKAERMRASARQRAAA